MLNIHSSLFVLNLFQVQLSISQNPLFHDDMPFIGYNHLNYSHLRYLSLNGYGFVTKWRFFEIFNKIFCNRANKSGVYLYWSRVWRSSRFLSASQKIRTWFNKGLSAATIWWITAHPLSSNSLICFKISIRGQFCKLYKIGYIIESIMFGVNIWEAKAIRSNFLNDVSFPQYCVS